MSTEHTHTDDSTDTDPGIETATKFVTFTEPAIGQTISLMVTRFRADEQTIPHGSGYVNSAYRQYVRLSQSNSLQVTDNDVYALIRKFDELTHHEMDETVFWAFLRWLDTVEWARIPQQYETTAKEWQDADIAGRDGATETSWMHNRVFEAVRAADEERVNGGLPAPYLLSRLGFEDATDDQEALADDAVADLVEKDVLVERVNPAGVSPIYRVAKGRDTLPDLLES